MNYLIMQAIGSMGLFASRAFVPAFAAALMLRFGPHLPIIHDWGLLELTGIRSAPSWFTSDASLLILGILAALEIGSTKNSDARALLNLVDQYFKPVMAALTTLGVAITIEDQEFLQGIQEGAAMAVVPVAAGMTMTSVGASVAAAGTFVTSSTRAFLVGAVQDADEDDDTGLQRLVSWGEDLWAMFGLFFLILFPVIMLALIGLVMGLVFLLRWWVYRREEASKIDCPGCGSPMYRSALVCGRCGQANPEPKAVGLLGRSRADLPAEPDRQPFKLAEAKRCPRCATRLEARHPHQACPTCQHDPFGDAGFTRAYVDRVSARLPLVLIITGILGTVWVIGVIPAVIYYRLAVVAPFRRYIPRHRNFAMKWGLRLVFILLLSSQVVPFVGVVALPIMALLSFLAYRRQFVCLAERKPAEQCD